MLSKVVVGGVVGVGGSTKEMIGRLVSVRLNLRDAWVVEMRMIVRSVKICFIGRN